MNYDSNFYLDLTVSAFIILGEYGKVCQQSMTTFQDQTSPKRDYKNTKCNFYFVNKLTEKKFFVYSTITLKNGISNRRQFYTET